MVAPSLVMVTSPISSTSICTGSGRRVGEVGHRDRDVAVNLRVPVRSLAMSDVRYSCPLVYLYYPLDVDGDGTPGCSDGGVKLKHDMTPLRAHWRLLVVAAECPDRPMLTLSRPTGPKELFTMLAMAMQAETGQEEKGTKEHRKQQSVSCAGIPKAELYLAAQYQAARKRRDGLPRAVESHALASRTAGS